MTPIWHRVSTNKNQVDGVDGLGADEAKISSSGFDLSGLDFHTAGTLEKNFSFYLLPSSDSTGAFHFETVMARLDNINGSPWLNLKLGKFELDNLLSEKRILTLTGNGVFISSITSFHCTTATFSGRWETTNSGGGNGALI